MSHDVSFPVVRGTKIRQFRGGEGETAVFLHGGAGLAVWTPFFQKLAAACDLRVPEHPGFGQSDNPEWLQSVQDLALFYLDYLAENDLRGVHLIANSFGGWVAAELAVRDCTRLKSLTLIGPSGFAPREGATDIFRWSYEESSRNLFHNQAIAERALSQPLTIEQVSTLVKNHTTVVRLGAAGRLSSPDLPKWLHRIVTPSLVVWGKYDKLCPASHAEQWAQHMPHAHVKIVDNAGHLPHAEQPDVVGDAVLEHIRQAR